jgi:iron complex outermembrane recepter protein
MKIKDGQIEGRKRHPVARRAHASALTATLFLPLIGLAAENASVLGVVTVTATREAQSVSETPASISTVGADTVAESRPTHPKDLLNQIPGVRLSTLSGEGHSTSIRQPLTTAAVYLYLEDGIPTRSTGFFNHNALYEINVPQSGGIEVNRGPGSALYGSDAIGGMVNVLTREPPREAEFDVTGEVGSHGWRRMLLGGGDTVGDNAWRASVNLTHSDGWHDDAGYDRQTGTFRWDRYTSDDAMFKTILSFSKVDQEHVGTLSEQEYRESPRSNNIPFSYREVDAFRLSTAYEHETETTLLSVTPYFRDNRMDIIPNWTVSYDPNRYVTKNQSFGLLSKYRMDFEPMRMRFIVGLDVDYSPGSRDEDSIALNRVSNDLGGTTYSLNHDIDAVQIYHYDVTFRSISPYAHGEFSPTERLRITAGLRYDDMQYDYTNKLSDGEAGAIQGVQCPPGVFFPCNGWYGHVESTTVSYSRLSPKLGATYEITPNLNGFVAYSNAFRAPSEGQVFRGSRESTAERALIQAESQLDLKPVTVDSYEVGLRGAARGISYEMSVYYMPKKNDIVNYQDPETNQRTAMNAGETLHQGVEASLGIPVGSHWRVDTSLSYARHTYEDWVVSESVDYSGNEMSAAPRVQANTRLTYSPDAMKGGRVQLEWLKLGSYWRDDANTSKYAGHDLFSLRANYPFGKQFEVYGNITNLLDKKYAETSGLSNGEPTYNVGLPRTMYVGLEAKW